MNTYTITTHEGEEGGPFNRSYTEVTNAKGDVVARAYTTDPATVAAFRAQFAEQEEIADPFTSYVVVWSRQGGPYETWFHLANVNLRQGAGFRRLSPTPRADAIKYVLARRANGSRATLYAVRDGIRREV